MLENYYFYTIFKQNSLKKSRIRISEGKTVITEFWSIFLDLENAKKQIKSKRITRTHSGVKIEKGAYNIKNVHSSELFYFHNLKKQTLFRPVSVLLINKMIMHKNTIFTPLCTTCAYSLCLYVI